MNHLILSEKELSRDQFLDSNSASGLYLLDSTIDVSNLGNSLGFAENNGMVYTHDISVECQNTYISLKQYLRYFILNEKLSHDVNGPSNFPLVRFKDSLGLNIWENFISQNKFGGKFSYTHTLNIDNGIIILINDLKIINGGSINNDYINLKLNSIVATNINISIRFSEGAIKVINHYDNSQIGTTIIHNFKEEHNFLIAIKFDTGALKIGFHFYGKDETTFTTGFFATGIFLSSGGNNILEFNNGLTELNQSCSLSGIETFINTGLNFVTSTPSSNELNKIYNNFTLYDYIIDTKISDTNYPIFKDSVYTKKYNNDKLVICFASFRSDVTLYTHNLTFMIYDKITDSFMNKKSFTFPIPIFNYVSGQQRSRYRPLSEDAPLNIIIDNNTIYLLIEERKMDTVNGFCKTGMYGIFSENLGLTWKRISDGTINNFSDSLEHPFQSGFMIDSKFAIANDNKALLHAASYQYNSMGAYWIDKDSDNNYWAILIDNSNYHFGTKIVKFDNDHVILGEWEHYALRGCSIIKVIGSYIFALTSSILSGNINQIVKLDKSNPMNVIKSSTFVLSLGDAINGNTIVTDGTYIYLGTAYGKILKLDLNLNLIATYTTSSISYINGLLYYGGYLYFVNQINAKIYRVDISFVTETNYTLTGYIGNTNFVMGMVTDGTYIFICNNNSTAGKIIRFNIATQAVISAALSVNNNNAYGQVYYDANYVVCGTFNAIDRFAYPALTARSSIAVSSDFIYTNFYYYNNFAHVSYYATVASQLYRPNIYRLVVNTTPMAYDATNAYVYYGLRIIIKSHTDVKQIRNYDQIYLYYTNGIPNTNPLNMRYGKFVGAITVAVGPGSGVTQTAHGLALFKIPSSSNFALIYHSQDGVGYSLYAQQINFDGTNFTLSGSPVKIIDQIGTLEQALNSFHAVIDTDNNYYYIFGASRKSNSPSPDPLQMNTNLYCIYNTTGNLFSGWNYIATPIVKNMLSFESTNLLFTAFMSIEYFNNDLIRCYPFSNPNGYNETVPYNFILLQSNIKYKKPSSYFNFIPDYSFLFSSNELVSTNFSGDISFMLYQNNSPKTILDSNSINKQADGTFSEMIDNINIKFGGNYMYDFDKVYVKSDYQIKGDEIASISPSEVWKSVDDLSMARITFDSTLEGNLNLKFIFNAFGLMNTNFRTAKILACNDGDFSTPDFSQTIYSNYVYKDNGSNIYSDTISAIDDNYIKFTNLNSTKLNLFSLIGKYIETTGTIKKVYKVINCDKYGIYTSGNPDSDGVLAGDTIYLFGDRFLNVTANFGLESGIQKYRYIGVEIPIQPTYDGYFQIGKFLIGLGLKLTYARSVPYTDTLSSGVQINKSIGMQSYPVINHKPLFETEIAWNKLRRDGKEELESFLRYTELNKYNFIFCNNPDSIVKDDNTLNNFQLVRLTNDYELSHELGDDSIFVVSLNLMEEL